MRFKFIDSFNNELDISTLSEQARYKPRIESYNQKLNNDTLAKFGRAGSFAVGDNTFKETDFSVNFYILANTDTIYREKVLTLLNFFKAKNAPFFFQIEYDDLVTLRMSIQITEFNHKYRAEGLEHRFADLSIKVKMLDPFLEDVDYTEVTFTSVNPSDVITVTIADTFCYEAYPIFIITSNGFNPNISLSSETNLISISLSDSNFDNLKVMTVNSETGEIKLGDNIKPNIKTGGYFLKLEQGANDILFQGTNSVDIIVRYKRRYLL